MSDAERGVEHSSDRLTSWKEVAAYLGREVRTVQRWEKGEGLPVHRHRHERGGTVYALRSELDAWLASRSPEAASVPAAREEPEEPRSGHGRFVAVAAVALVATGSLATLRGFDSPPDPREPSLADSVAPDALAAWRRGSHQLDRGTGRGYDQALASFGEAIRLAPD
jgi:hypothetical protein